MDIIWIGIGLSLILILAFRLIRTEHRKEERALESLKHMVEKKRTNGTVDPEPAED